jgi:hypothetical protein
MVLPWYTLGAPYQDASRRGPPHLPTTMLCTRLPLTLGELFLVGTRPLLAFPERFSTDGDLVQGDMVHELAGDNDSDDFRTLERTQ